MTYLFNTLPFPDGSRMTNIWKASWVDDPKDANLVIGHLIRLPDGQHADVEADFLTSHLPLQAGGIAGVFIDDNPWLFVLQIVPADASAFLAGDDDPLWPARDALDRALSFNPGAEMTVELRWSRHGLIEAYEDAGVAAQRVRDWPVAALLGGLLAECCYLPLSAIVDGYRTGCAFSGIDHACELDVFNDVFARWQARLIPQPSEPVTTAGEEQEIKGSPSPEADLLEDAERAGRPSCPMCGAKESRRIALGRWGPRTPPDWHCSFCGHIWDDPNTTGERPRWLEGATEVHALAELIALTGAQTQQELCEFLESATELDDDLWLDLDAAEPNITLILGIRNEGVGLTFPFSLSDLYATITGLEKDLDAAVTDESADGEEDDSTTDDRTGDFPGAAVALTDVSVQAAQVMAASAHHGQVDKAGLPYIEHHARVIGHLVEPTREETVVAWLHDVVEDTAIRLADVQTAFGPQVADAVDAITHRAGEPSGDYYARVKANPIALTVKVADLADNTDPRRLEILAPNLRARLEAKYAIARRELGLAGSRG